MKIKCRHGFFTIEEQRAGEASDFASLFGFTLAPYQDKFTFDFLKSAPKYALAGKSYLGAIANTQFEGEPWDVMRANGFIYNFNTGLLTVIESITQMASIKKAANYYFSDGLILPGSVTDDGSRVTDYSAWFYFDTMKFRYSEVTFG